MCKIFRQPQKSQKKFISLKNRLLSRYFIKLLILYLKAMSIFFTFASLFHLTNHGYKTIFILYFMYLVTLNSKWNKKCLQVQLVLNQFHLVWILKITMYSTTMASTLKGILMNTQFKKPLLIVALCAAFGGLLATSANNAYATDHGDTALFNGTARNDARLTDYFMLNRGQMLAFIIDTNPTIGTATQLPTQSQSNYIFPTDVSFKAYIDNHSKVTFDDTFRNAHLGGTIVDNSKIKENFVFHFTFDNNNQLTTTMSSPDTELGISGFYPTEVNQGDLVYVLGSGFNSEETKVRVNGRRAPFSKVLSDNVMVFIAPFGGKTGAVTITTETEDEDNESKSRVTSASELVITKFNGFNPDAIKNLNNIANNQAVNDAIKAGNVLALAEIGLPVKTFSGLRDDPFIRIPQNGKNIAAMAVELPQSLFTHGRQKVLISWGASGFDTVDGASADVAGRSFGSMFPPENGIINKLHPSQHVAALEAAQAAGVAGTLQCQTPYQLDANGNTIATVPALRKDCADESQRMLKAADVAIFDTTKPQHFPNGRELADDQVDLIAPYDARVNTLLINPANGENTGGRTSPTANDVPHSATFPYLGLPQP